MPPAQEKDDNAINTIIEDLREDIWALRSKCDGLERDIQALKLRCNTHERVLEVYREEIVSFKDGQGTLDTMYRGEKFELISRQY